MSQFLVSPLFICGSAVLALIWAVVLIQNVLSASPGNAKMQEVADAVRSGAQAYLNRQSKTILIFAVLIGVLLWFALGSYLYAVGFWLGALLSGASGYIGMTICVRANVRTAQAAADSGIEKALGLAFRGGAVTGFFVIGLALIAVAGFYFVALGAGIPLEKTMHLILAIGFGSSLISLFARVGGGIYTKAADVGADLVGKVEARIPEDDPRNPATIADNVGDNVGDCAGMAADVFETYAVTAISSMLFGFLTFGASADSIFILLPLVIGAIGVFSSIIGSLCAKLGASQNVMGALYKSLIVAGVLSVVGFYFVIPGLIPADAVAGHPGYGMSLFWASLVGIIVGIGLFVITEYYTATNYRPVREIAKASASGAGTNIIAGIAYGLESTFAPVLLIAGGVVVAYLASEPYGLYGVSIATMAMLSLSGIIITLDAYGPITDNAAGIAEMSGLEKEARVHLDALDAVGNTTKAVTKTFAIGSAGLAALTLFAAYVQEFKAAGAQLTFSLEDPRIIVGLLLGGSIPFLFSSFLMRSVGTAAFSVIEEVRRQFREIPGILEGTAKPDYACAVDIVTKAALKEMILPSIIAVISPVIVGFVLGPVTLGGFLLGVIITGIFVALSMANGGAAWDNAKKYIEQGNYGGKGSDAHAAAVVGDTVGDPYKDTAGPAINPLIKVINTVAILMAGLLLTHSLNLF